MSSTSAYYHQSGLVSNNVSLFQGVVNLSVTVLSVCQSLCQCSINVSITILARNGSV